MAGIYIHIPFCKQACYYCDFHFSTNQEIQSELVKAIATELKLQADYLGKEKVQTIYFGGGTPSLLNNNELAYLLEVIRSKFQVDASSEITLEANPDDLTPSKLHEIAQAGVNRLSIGIQSFHPDILTFLNRAHDSVAAVTSFQEARKAGFKNITIDLIYAIPGETIEQWKEDIRKALELNPDHVSCYSLTIEEKTVFGKRFSTGKLKATEDDVAATHLEILMEELEQAGYEHYEVSNFSKPGFRSKHNSNYWNQVKYLGVGPSAHSYDGHSRQFNISNNHLYLKSIQKGVVPFEREQLSKENRINEYILTSLRTSWGTNLKKMKDDFGFDMLRENRVYLSTIIGNGWAILESDVLRLTRKGKLLADKISSDLFVMKS